MTHQADDMQSVDSTVSIATEAMLRLVVQNIPQGAVIVVDRALRYVLAEGEELHATGYDPHAMIGRRIHDVLPPSSLPMIEEGYQRALKGETFIIERYMNGRYYISRFSPVRDADGTILYGMAIVQNLTELSEVKRARNDLQAANARLNASLEELRAANQEVQRFTYIVSHDLRAPLISLTGFTQLLRESIERIVSVIDDAEYGLIAAVREPLTEDLEDTIPTALKFISAATQRLDTLTSAVLKLSRFGRLEVRLEEVDVRSLIEGILASMQSRLQERGARVDVQSLPPIVADRIALEIIFGNLLDNATKYLDPKRPGAIAIEMEVQDEGTVYRVRDNGRGIDPHDYAKVFEPFQRGDVPDTEGEGIGLAYVQTLVRRLGGQISFESELGVGTVFTVTLPHRRLPSDPRIESLPRPAEQ